MTEIQIAYSVIPRGSLVDSLALPVTHSLIPSVPLHISTFSPTPSSAVMTDRKPGEVPWVSRSPTHLPDWSLLWLWWVSINCSALLQSKLVSSQSRLQHTLNASLAIVDKGTHWQGHICCIWNTCKRHSISLHRVEYGTANVYIYF